MHVPNEFVAAVAAEVGGLIWASPNDEGAAEGDPPTYLAGACTKEQLSPKLSPTGGAAQQRRSPVITC